MRQGISILILGAIGLSGCSGAPKAPDHRAEFNQLLRADIGPVDENRVAYLRSAHVDPSRGDAVARIDLDRRVRKWLRVYGVKERAGFQRKLDRGEAYRDMVERILVEEGMPPQLYYLALVESGFSAHAESHASAVGMWQFMPGTGRRYGLRSDMVSDDRRDPVQATRAAARHLKDLYRRFGSWYLAMAAYNAGPERVARAVRKARTRDYWELAKRRMLPLETLNYVPKFLAAVVIGQHPEEFGLRQPVARGWVFPEVQAKVVAPGTSLQKVSSRTGVPVETFRKLNPHLRKDVAPMSSRRAKVWVPARGKETARAPEPHRAGPAPTPRRLSPILAEG
jgi:membrane-bound lytic murein transglycosylase D